MAKVLQQREPAGEWSEVEQILFSKEFALLEQEEAGTVLQVIRPQGFTWQYRLVDKEPTRHVRITYLIEAPVEVPIEAIRQDVYSIAQQNGIVIESVSDA